jgi:predicted nucleotidyltransferase
MSKNLLNLSEKIDPFRMELIEIISEIAQKMDIPFFIVGATARDVILTNCYDIQTTRATVDIDFGIRVSDWDQFELLKKILIETERFELSNKPHRLIYQQVIPVDIIPFGSIASYDRSISWPPENEIVMSTIGFEDAYEQSITIKIKVDSDLCIKFASLNGIVIMKLISWNDNAARRRKDATDILLIIENYLDAGNIERIYDEEMDLIDVDDFDYAIAGARLLGRDIAKSCRHETLNDLLVILDQKKEYNNIHKLAADMREGYSSEEFDKIIELLEFMKLGMIDIKEGLKS